jgi:hypothetical protein
VSKLREILRPEAERRAKRCALARPGGFSFFSLTHSGQVTWVDAVLDILCDDLDCNTRALAVALGLCEDCRWGVESAPRMVRERGLWVLRFFPGEASGAWFAFPSENFPGLDAFTDQSQAMSALRCIWAALEREEGGQP